MLISNTHTHKHKHTRRISPATKPQQPTNTRFWLLLRSWATRELTPHKLHPQLKPLPCGCPPLRYALLQLSCCCSYLTAQHSNAHFLLAATTSEWHPAPLPSQSHQINQISLYPVKICLLLVVVVVILSLIKTYRYFIEISKFWEHFWPVFLGKRRRWPDDYYWLASWYVRLQCTMMASSISHHRACICIYIHIHKIHAE